MCQACNTTNFIFAVFVVSLSLTHCVNCSVFYIYICGFSTQPHFSQSKSVSFQCKLCSFYDTWFKRSWLNCDCVLHYVWPLRCYRSVLHGWGAAAGTPDRAAWWGHSWEPLEDCSPWAEGMGWEERKGDIRGKDREGREGIGIDDLVTRDS